MIPDKYKSNHLFLLIGTNPLPNYVAARLLLLSSGFLYLLHTKETKPIAERLRLSLRRHLSGAEVENFEIDSTDNVKIRDEVAKILTSRKLGSVSGKVQSVGLHYTGGTAAMSVHTYAAFEQFFKESLVRVVYSYLDARTLSLRFDGHGGELATDYVAGSLCKIELDELAKLHGYGGFKKELERASSNQFAKKIINALIEIHSTEEGYLQWREYGQSGYVTLPNVTQCPLLTPFDAVVKSALGINPEPADVARLLARFSQLTSYSKWFNGEWLEDYVLDQITDLSESMALHSFGKGLQPIRGERRSGSELFDLDVAAMRGYQLFAISCMVAGVNGKKVKDNYKEHLLEVYVRARQLGGDEARIALVGHYQDPALLQQEVEESWFAEGKIRVFGLPHLEKLKDHLRDWFKTANL